ncbi:MAG: exonuclease SbcCD subunit D [Lachnospiraceae bacterium]|nr:exonuclease SbcCD subunit D [Butyrivibrio sp.]MCM1344540.1 exonuclease SbcCD subunit D [Muribaculaceae bacterium]MCM1411852.1 exonuclease SbcCD subunit D [Lachnospiraceae bacterium]
MKLLHLGDLHIGKTVCDFHMIEDQRYMLEQILDLIETQKIDAVLIAGDVYDKSIPSEEAVRLLDWFLCRLSERDTEVFLISGNHDSDERLHFGSSLFEANKIHICARYDGTVYQRTLQDSFGKVNIYLLPFVKASQVRYYYPEEEIASYEDAVKTALAHGDIDPSERNILAAHQFVAGRSEEPRLGGSEGAATLHVGTIEKIGYDCFDDFDYVALGHIHSPQKIGRDTVRYSGSLLKYSLSEADDTKSVPVITLAEKGRVSVDLIELKPLRDMRHIKGRMDQLLDPKNITSPEDYIYVTLTDDAPIDNAMGIFQQYYPNTMKIVYDNTHTREVQTVDITNITRERSYPQLISDFYRMMYDCEISDEELRIMKEVAKEAGVSDEAD